MSTVEPGSSRYRQQPEETNERRLTEWQRALRWTLWLAFLAAAVYNSHSVRFSGLEWLLLAAAIGVSIWCMAKPMGGPKVELTKPAHLLGTFESRASWGLLLFGAVLTVGGVAGGGAAVYDVATGRATISDVVHDIGVFIEGWFTELVLRGFYDAELEKTHAYALFLLLIPGMFLLTINSAPVFHRGSAFRVETDGSVSVQRDGGAEPLLEHQYWAVAADGTTITFSPSLGGTAAPVLPQARVFCRENGARLSSELSAEFFTALLVGRGFDVDATTPGRSGFTAQRR